MPTSITALCRLKRIHDNQEHAQTAHSKPLELDETIQLNRIIPQFMSRKFVNMPKQYKIFAI